MSKPGRLNEPLEFDCSLSMWGTKLLLHGVIVERDEASRDLLLQVLAGLDWKTACFSSADAAEEAAVEAWAVFLGIDTANGTEPVPRMRLIAPKASIFAFVSNDNASLAAELRSKGADTVLIRPVSEPDLIDAIVRALVKRRV